MSIGSTTTAALLACAAAACAWQSALNPRGRKQQRPGFWVRCSAILGCLALLYALEAGDWLLAWGRNAALSHGLYPWRRPFQAALLLAGLLITIGALRRLPGAANRIQPQVSRSVAVVATSTVLLVFAMRAVSLHGVDAALSFPIQGLGLGRWLEWIAAAAICGAALLDAPQRGAAHPTLNVWRHPDV